MMEEIYIELLKKHICEAVDDADKCKSRLPIGILELDGMSGRKTRHLYNNICNLPKATYCEIGTYKGSSLISAFYGNDINCYCVDNWSQFGGKEDFEKNLEQFASFIKEKVAVLDQDCWTIEKANLPTPIDIFLYDGEHTYEAHKTAITHFAPFLADISIIMVDDWMCDWAGVKRGTMDGIVESGLEILFHFNIGLSIPNEYHQDGDTFWNGCGIFLCRKTQT